MYAAVIIGSGYGGSVLGARLARHGRVLMLERGRRWLPGDFPESVPGIARSYRTRRNPMGLWAMRLGRGTGNAYVSAFGGASLVNYGISMRPDSHVFETWPIKSSDLSPFLDRAESVLKPSINPSAAGMADKRLMEALAPGFRADIPNTVDWSRCDGCGHCVPGCNRGAKNSLDQTYLKMAEKDGLEVRCGMTAHFLRPRPGGGWELFVSPTGHPLDLERIPTRRVLLAAGTFGTLDLLQASRSQLPLSSTFGQRISMNGDGLGFLYNGRQATTMTSGYPISTAAHLIEPDEFGQRRTLLVMAGRLPRSVLRFSAVALGLVARLHRQSNPVVSRGLRLRRVLSDLLAVRPRGAANHSIMFKMTAQDSASGQIRFTDSGESVVDWPDYLNDPVMRLADVRLREWWQNFGGRLVPDIGNLPKIPNFGVHPMGGCRMGTSIDEAVVDTYGRVFSPKGGVYDGLRVVDGSVIPSSLGVPSSLTIAAMAERTAADLVKEISLAA